MNNTTLIQEAIINASTELGVNTSNLQWID